MRSTLTRKRRKEKNGGVRCSVAVGQKQKIAGRRQWLAHLQQSKHPSLFAVEFTRTLLPNFCISAVSKNPSCAGLCKIAMLSLNSLVFVFRSPSSLLLFVKPHVLSIHHSSGTTTVYHQRAALSSEALGFARLGGPVGKSPLALPGTRSVINHPRTKALLFPGLGLARLGPVPPRHVLLRCAFYSANTCLPGTTMSPVECVLLPPVWAEIPQKSTCSRSRGPHRPLTFFPLDFFPLPSSWEQEKKTHQAQRRKFTHPGRWSVAKTSPDEDRL